MDDRELRLLVSRFNFCWSEASGTGWERSLAAVLRGCTPEEADAALAELTETSPSRPSVLDVVARVEAVRRRGRVSPGRTAGKAVRAAALMAARQALLESADTA
jgi:hypothetical protein